MANRVAPVVRPKHSPTKSLSEVAEQLGIELERSAPADLTITGLTIGSHDVHPGDLFAALPGDHVHGATFAADAASAGAAAILTDAAGADLVHRAGVSLPVLLVEHPRLLLGTLAEWLYRSIGDPATILGITGTNGKTSTTYYMEAILKHLGHVTGLSTTVERHVGEHIIGSALTTPEAPQLQAMLARMRELGADTILLEVSAQAVSRHRIDGTHFSVVGFTNLSPEHLDEYGDIETYYQAKRGLFVAEFTDHAVISLESSWGRRLYDECEVPKVSVGFTDEADWKITITAQHAAGGSCELTGPDGVTFFIQLSVPGAHMAVNAAISVLILLTSGVSEHDIADALAAHVLSDVYLPGRMELVSGEGAPTFYVDYAHTPDAIDRTLAAVRAHTTGRVIAILGADGGRDPYKRPDMGIAAARGADIVIFDDINPRFENPDDIRETLVTAANEAKTGATILDVGDPSSAIRTAVALATVDDTIIVCGPGDEDYYEVRGKKLPFSSRAAARQALAEAGWAVRPAPRHALNVDVAGA